MDSKKSGCNRSRIFYMEEKLVFPTI